MKSLTGSFSEIFFFLVKFVFPAWLNFIKIQRQDFRGKNSDFVQKTQQNQKNRPWGDFLVGYLE
jgi:hypothetical protein